MEVEVLLFLLMFLLGVFGSFFSGMLGIGGAIINFPLILYIPPLFDVASFTGKEVASISMFQVFFASLAGVLAFRKQSRISGPVLIHKRLVLDMGISIMVGSLLGGMGSMYLTGHTINFIYGIIAIIAVILMLIPSKGKKEIVDPEQVTYNKFIAINSSFIVGIVSGIVGAGGAFILIPIMLTVLKIPARIAIASSLAIVFISAVGGVIGKLVAGGIPFWPTLFIVIGSLLGAPIGARISKQINVKYLRYTLIGFISLTAIKIWTSIL